MWDGNCGDTRRASRITIVEREPMWDGNLKKSSPFGPPLFRLSENQCGMETYSLASDWSVVCELSENQCGMETYGNGPRSPRRIQLSENQCGMETHREVVLVYVAYWLSENQCGMETD